METNDRTLNHISNMITSLDKNFKNIYLGKPLKMSELYLYDIIFNFLEGCYSKLSSKQSRELLHMYNRLPSLSDQVCRSFVKQEFQNRPKFIQAEREDIINNGNTWKVYYWQDNNVANTPTDIYNQTLTAGFFNNKSYLSYNVFNLGVKVDYTAVGKIAFEIVSPGDETFQIFDILRNDVTDGFQRFYNPTTKNVTFVSILNYAHGNIEFKIK